MEKMKIFFLIFCTMLLQVLDLVSTKIALASPYLIELNPFGNYFVAGGLWLEFLFVKLGILLAALLLGLWLTTRESIVRMALLMNTIMAIVVANNFYWGIG